MITAKDISDKIDELGLEFKRPVKPDFLASAALMVSRQWPRLKRFPVRAAVRIVGVCHGGKKLTKAQADALNNWVNETEAPKPAKK